MGPQLKTYFFIGMAIIIVMSIGLIGFGAYLNISSEQQIARQLDNRTLEVQGERVMTRDILPVVHLDQAQLTADGMADAVARIDGKIVDVYAARNSHVEQGSLLMSLENDQMPLRLSQAEGDILKAQALLNRTESKHRRYQQLLASNATSAEKAEEAQTEYQTAQVSLAQARDVRDQLQVMQSYQQVTAPLSGEVMLLYKTPGSFVTAGTAVALVGDFTKLKYTFSSENHEEEAGFIHRMLGQEMLFSVAPDSMSKVYHSEYGVGNTGYAQKFPAHIVRITPALSDEAAMRSVVIEIDNSSHLLEPLMYRDVTFQATQAQSCLTVSREALLGHDAAAVFVVDGEGIVHKRTVKTGASDNDYVEILSGLEPDEVVIVSDKEGLADGMKVHVTMKDGEE